MVRWLVNLSGVMAAGVVGASCGEVEVAGGDGIILEYAGTLGEGRDEDGALYGLQSIVFDSKERAVILARDNHDGMPFVLEPDGSFVTVLARSGEGPGELESPGAVHVDGRDSLFVWDRGTGRMSVFGPDLKYVRTYPVEGYAGGTAVRLGTGDWLHGNRISHGYPFVLIGSEGLVLREWGDSVDYIGPRNGMPMRMPWLIGPGREGTAWALKTHFRFNAIHFDAHGNEIANLELDADWFEPYDRPEASSPDRPPQSVLSGIREDSDGLWLVGQIADSDWRSALGESYRVEGTTAYRIEDPDRLVDTVIELRDPASGALRAQYRDNRFMRGASGGSPNLVYAIRRDDLGFQIRDVYRLHYEPVDGGSD